MFQLKKIEELSQSIRKLNLQIISHCAYTKETVNWLSSWPLSLISILFFLYTIIQKWPIIQLSPEGEMNSGGYNYSETQSVEVCIHHSSPTLRGIIVLVFTKSDG